MGLILQADMNHARDRISEYVPFAATERLLAFYDDTTFGSAKAGLVITDVRLVTYDKKDVRELPLAQVTQIDLRKDGTGESEYGLRVVLRDGPPLEKTMFLTPGGLLLLANILESLARSDLVILLPNTSPGAQSSELNAHIGRHGFVLSTTQTIEGRKILNYFGVVSAEAVVSVQGLWSGSKAYVNAFTDARVVAFHQVETCATELGANAVVGIEVDYQGVGANGETLLVSVNGTAVVLSPLDATPFRG